MARKCGPSRRSKIKKTKKKTSMKWSEDDTNKFYRTIQLFGTDFQMISNLFKNRSRK